MLHAERGSDQRKRWVRGPFPASGGGGPRAASRCAGRAWRRPRGPKRRRRTMPPPGFPPRPAFAPIPPRPPRPPHPSWAARAGRGRMLWLCGVRPAAGGGLAVTHAATRPRGSAVKHGRRRAIANDPAHAERHRLRRSGTASAERRASSGGARGARGGGAGRRRSCGPRDTPVPSWSWAQPIWDRVTVFRTLTEAAGAGIARSFRSRRPTVDAPFVIVSSPGFNPNRAERRLHEQIRRGGILAGRGIRVRDGALAITSTSADRARTGS
jgi:hypothetical protein